MLVYHSSHLVLFACPSHCIENVTHFIKYIFIGTVQVLFCLIIYFFSSTSSSLCHFTFSFVILFLLNPFLLEASVCLTNLGPWLFRLLYLCRFSTSLHRIPRDSLYPVSSLWPSISWVPGLPLYQFIFNLLKPILY